ncbi:MCE family protein [Williamsia sp. DF01-3]|uniref:MCE family protein n=1 Tax=Williamsia sp. DF01-3 TaxID=2934157 RepID=UPI001FF29186|nr:MCE family protein [Williamsia sp. DF01-3]MCK0517362.1 MCE family protein [Williamsia sp. DF01-3]
MKIGGTIAKFMAFATVMVLVLAILVVVFGQFRFGSSNSYSARFTSVSGLKSGQFVRIAGVDVGRVKEVRVVDGTAAQVDFTLDSSVDLTRASRAAVRYQNLIGDRYLEIMEGAGDPLRLAPGGQIPIEQTAPALDLDALIGGFRPLLKALDPDQVNTVSMSLVQVFQGQGGSIASILRHTAEVTNALADRDALIGSVIKNLNDLLGTVSRHNEQFDNGIDKLQQLISGLSERSDQLTSAVAGISNASETIASLLDKTRPDIANDVSQINRVATTVNNDYDYVDNLLTELPQSYRTLSRLGLYGNFFTFFLCDATLKVNGPQGDPVYIDIIGQRAGRCTA